MGRAEDIARRKETQRADSKRLAEDARRSTFRSEASALLDEIDLLAAAAVSSLERRDFEGGELRIVSRRDRSAWGRLFDKWKRVELATWPLVMWENAEDKYAAGREIRLASDGHILIGSHYGRGSGFIDLDQIRDAMLEENVTWNGWPFVFEQVRDALKELARE